MFKFWRYRESKEVFTKFNIKFTLTAGHFEYVVARHYKEITSKKMLRDVMRFYLWDNGCEFDENSISYNPDEVKLAYEKARLTVQKFMPEFYE